MRLTTRATLCLTVAMMLLVGSTAVASAALPEFATLGSKPTTFTGKSGSIRMETTTGDAWVCESSSISGEIVPPKELRKVIIQFKGPIGCGGFCRQNAHLGYWETRELKGSIGYTNKATKLVGLLLEPVSEPVANCQPISGIYPEKILGSIIGSSLQKIGERKLTFSWTQSKGVQTVKHFEGEETMHSLKGLFPSGNIEAGFEATPELETAGFIELHS
jgi:hypothetical protein